MLFSRSKRQMVTYTSLKPTQILEGRPGTEMLRGWLEYTETKKLPNYGVSQGEPDSPFEEHVIELLEGEGYMVTPQVSASGYSIDIGVRHEDYPYGYIMGVECDGASYHSSKSARDRDRLRQQVLEGLGWTFYRIWSTDWFNNPKTEFRKLKQALEKRKDYLCKRVEDDSGIVLVDQNLTGEPEITADVANDLQEGNDDSVTQSILFQDPIASGAFPDKVLPGTTFTLVFEEPDIPDETYKIANTNEEPNPSEKLISSSSPIAEAVLECESDDVVRIIRGNRVLKAEVTIISSS